MDLTSSAGVRPVAVMPPDLDRSRDRRGPSTRVVYRRRAEKPMVLTVPDIAINDGSGYHVPYGEATKRASESSVLNAANAPAKA
jgi:hypothetical protein